MKPGGFITNCILKLRIKYVNIKCATQIIFSFQKEKNITFIKQLYFKLELHLFKIRIYVKVKSNM